MSDETAPAETRPRPALPEGRYGKSQERRGRPWLRWVYLLLALAVAGSIAYVGYRNLGSAPIEGQRVGFQERPGNAMEITIDVNRDDPERAAVCIVRVRDISGAESGRREVFVPPQETRLSAVITSIQRPVTADVFGCSYDVPRYLSTP